LVKLLIGGSPCTYWSISQKNNRETTASGIGWELFRNYLIAKEKFHPDYFLYENNKSAAQEIKDAIKEHLGAWDGTFFMADTGVRYIEINSALVSAQNRQRFYVHNCGEVGQPADRGILLKDILETGESWNEKSYTLDANYCKTGGTYNPKSQHSYSRHMAAEPVCVAERGRYRDTGSRSAKSDGTVEQYIEPRIDGKTNALTTVQKDNAVCEPIEKSCKSMVAEPAPYAVPITKYVDRCIEKTVRRKGYLPEMFNCFNSQEITDKSPTLTATSGQSSATVNVVEPAQPGKKVYTVSDGQIEIKGKKYPIKLADGQYIIRKLTVKECCRLQTMQDDYCRAVSATQAYKGLGNGWTAEVVRHILWNAFKDIPKDEKILVCSMYDGIATGRYILDVMGFTNVEYHAYEIDKYAMQIAMSNYPDIIQHGDAFQVREDVWNIGT
jgi:site-specific DNA-cytosine methylase